MYRYSLVVEYSAAVDYSFWNKIINGDNDCDLNEGLLTVTH